MTRAAWPPSRRNRVLRADRRLLFTTAALRSAAYGGLSVVLALYLAAVGIDAAMIGLIFTAALAGGAVMTLALTSVADRLGRRRVLVVGAVLMALAGGAFAVSQEPALLVIAAIVGTISPSGKEVGPFLSIEQAALTEIVDTGERTAMFARYNLVSSSAGAVGSLAAGAPALAGLPGPDAYRAIIWAYTAVGILLALLFARLTARVEAGPVVATTKGIGLHRSRGRVFRLAGLFSLDAFAGSFVVQGIVAYWFALRFGVDVAALGAIFFAANLAAAISFLAASPLARRFGLLNTMVFTHLPSNVLLMLVPVMPTAPLATAALVARALLSQLDVPTRQSFTMAVVEPNERSAAAGVTSVARNTGAALGPIFAGWAIGSAALGIPFFVAGGLKIVYDLAVLTAFRNVHPPEEAAST